MERNLKTGRTKVDSKTVVDMRETFVVFWNYNEAKWKVKWD